ncbi:MAG: Peptidase S9 prolyl oligopeptidase active site domain protein [Candidatus Moranbacteria bacterium GW2011_GWF1_36_4]|nr:MAG: Peptidase S9 prolyl oligopeptidase active site domain protein [Candidatus Moranbacteria bacterium GW2011_GWF1_36_4]
MSNIKEQWEQRFYDYTILWMNPAFNAPHRAILVSNLSGKFQLHSYDFITKFSRQLTKKSQGTLFGSISSNGEYVFYLNDIAGGEHGHFMRIPFAGGHAIDITPSLPQYYSYEVSVNNTGNLLCFSASITTIECFTALAISSVLAPFMVISVIRLDTSPIKRCFLLSVNLGIPS